MQQPSSGSSRTVLALVGVIIIVAAIAAYFALQAPSGQDGARLSSLSSEVSSLSGVVSSQSQQIQSMQSTTGLGPTVTTTRTVTSTLTSTTTSLSVTTSLSTKTTTVTVVSTTMIGGTDFATMNATLSVPSGNGSGLLSLTVTNAGSDQITGIAVMVPMGSDPNADPCSSLCSVQMTYDGNIVTATNPMPEGASASGSTPADQAQPGTSYTIPVTITYDDGNQQTQNVQVTAQS